MPKIILHPDVNGWLVNTSALIGASVDRTILENGVCNLMLTGGRTAKKLYDYWAKTSFLDCKKVNLYWGDERAVPGDHFDSNYLLVKSSLFVGRPDLESKAYPIKIMEADLEASAIAYENSLPKIIDVLILSVGEDSHIASLFPNYDKNLFSNSRKVVPVYLETGQRNRITITPKVILEAKNVFLLALGQAKGRALHFALKTPNDYVSHPVNLVSNGIWLLDEEAAAEL